MPSEASTRGRWARDASSNDDRPTFIMDVRRGYDNEYRPMFQGSDFSCQLHGLEENSKLSVRVCYEVEKGRSHWRFKDLRTKSSVDTHESAAGIYIAKFLSGLWHHCSKNIKTEITASWDAAREHLLSQVDPDGSNSFTCGSDDELLDLTTRLVEAWNWEVARADDDQRRFRVVKDLLLSPQVLQRLMRAYGVDFLVDRVLKFAVSNAQLALRGHRQPEGLADELKMLQVVLQAFQTKQDFLRKAPTTAVGHVFSESLCKEPHGEDEADMSSRNHVINLVKTSVHELIDEAETLAPWLHDLTEEQRDKDVMPQVRQMMLRLEGAAEAGVYEVFDTVQERGEIENALESASEQIHSWVVEGGKMRLSRILDKQAATWSMPPTPRVEEESAPPQRALRSNQATVEAQAKEEAGEDPSSDQAKDEAQAKEEAGEDPVATAQSDQPESPRKTPTESPRKTPASTPRKTPAETPRTSASQSEHVEEEEEEAERTMLEEQNKILEVAALLSLGALESGPKSRALMRLDLPFDIEDPALWKEAAKSFYMVRIF